MKGAEELLSEHLFSWAARPCGHRCWRDQASRGNEMLEGDQGCSYDVYSMYGCVSLPGYPVISPFITWGEY